MPVTSDPRTCDKCKARSPVEYSVVPEEAWKIVVLNRWRRLCPGCFDQLAEATGVRFTFDRVEAISWFDRPVPRRGGRRRR